MERETKRKMLFLLSLPAESARQSYSVHWLPLNPKQCCSDTFVRQMHLSCDKKCQMRRRRLWFADSSLSHLGKVSSSSCLSRCCCSIKLTDYCALSESIASPIYWLTDCCCCTFCPLLLALFLWTWPTWLHFLFFLRLFLSLLLFWVLLPRADWLIGNGNQHLRGFGEQWHSGTSLYWFSTLLFSFFLGFSPLSFFLFMLCVFVRAIEEISCVCAGAVWHVVPSACGSVPFQERCTEVILEQCLSSVHFGFSSGDSSTPQF